MSKLYFFVQVAAMVILSLVATLITFRALDTLDENVTVLSARVHSLRLDSARKHSKIILLEKQLDVCKKWRGEK